ncbi:MAG: LacI family transcriptional regulator [Lachnospiraceae bacterium]|nr:LacI family transcriptional regulator [Lachnospiraceae bacterium]
MATIKDIAKECGVSIATVSNVLNGKNKASRQTEEKIMEAVRKYGYHPNSIAKGLRSRRSGIIGIIAEDVAQFTVPPIIEAIMRRLEESSYKTFLINLRLYSRWKNSWFNNEDLIKTVIDPALRDLESMMVDGIIYIAVHSRNTHVLSGMQGLPVVMAYAYEQSPEIFSVAVDDEEAGYEAVKHLTECGHKRIGIIAGLRDNMHTQLRLKGAKRALAEAGILFDEHLLRYADWDKEAGYRVSGDLMSEGGITAIFCMTDRMAGGLCQYLEEQGLTVGRDISVMGFDNQDLAEFCRPGLTTMALPLQEIGNTSAGMLLDLLSENPENIPPKGKIPDPLRLHCQLIKRNSVCRI